MNMYHLLKEKNMKKIFFAAFALISVFALTSCDQDFNDGIAGPLTSDDETAQTVAFGSGAITEVATINLADEADDTVKVCQIQAPTVTDANAKFSNYIITINGQTFEISPNGFISTAELNAIVEEAFGKRPEERTLEAVVRAYYNAGGQSIVAVSQPFNIKVIPAAPNVEKAYYFTGTLNGWNNSDTSYKLTNDGSDPYENPTFTCRIPASEDGSDIKFKMTPESGLGGDWSGCLGTGAEEGTFLYNNAGGDFTIKAVEGALFYDLTFNMLDLTWSYVAVKFESYIYEAGVNNSWGGIEQPLYCADGNGTYTGFFYAKEDSWTEGRGAFKFRGAKDNWDNGNWGAGTFTDEGGTLADNGDNLFAKPGFYRVDVDLANKTYTLTPINSVFVVGSAVNNDWDTGVEMTYDFDELCWKAELTLNEGVIKFKGNGTWDTHDGNWGGTMDNIINGSNDNIAVDVTGKVLIKFFPRCDTKSYCEIIPAN